MDERLRNAFKKRTEAEIVQAMRRKEIAQEELNAQRQKRQQELEKSRQIIAQVDFQRDVARKVGARELLNKIRAKAWKINGIFAPITEELILDERDPRYNIFLSRPFSETSKHTHYTDPNGNLVEHIAGPHVIKTYYRDFLGASFRGGNCVIVKDIIQNREDSRHSWEDGIGYIEKFFYENIEDAKEKLESTILQLTEKRIMERRLPRDFKS